MASAAGLPCDIDPALCAALRSQKTGKYCTSAGNIYIVTHFIAVVCRLSLTAADVDWT